MANHPIAETLAPDELAKRGTCYRIFNGAGVLLDIGSTADLKCQISQHSRHQSWWWRVDRIEATHYATMTDPQWAESRGLTGHKSGLYLVVRRVGWFEGTGPTRCRLRRSRWHVFRTAMSL